MFTYRYIDGDNGDEMNNDGNYNFKYVPKHNMNFGISRNFGAVGISLKLSYIGETEGPNEVINASTTFDASVNYSHEAEGIKLVHSVYAKNLTDELVLVPEFSRRKTINAISNGFGRRIVYNLSVEL